ncbi:MAG: protein of unknown function DUF3560 [Bacteriophage sp.]|nr:MAG: protein of unknown function DUF3560 [Bacteriophage sp.]UVY50314.1 MAG: protein of unknown function DUF3560 [Bacteriophage sp.]UWG81075.1 MAG: protein of unknown function DUF3560 [Bacteriophage sp.]
MKITRRRIDMNTERKYFHINESSARTAHNMMSMRDYSEGSTTAGYRSEVDKAYDIADKVAEKKPEEAERVYRLAERYSKKMAEYYNKESSIGMMCPSVMISGAGNFPVKKKERQLAAWERNHEFYQYVQGILAKIENILYGREIIKSDDERAIEKLEEKLEDMKKLQEDMKAANKALRLKDKEAGNDQLREIGYSEESIEELRKPDYLGRVGYPNFQLSNNNANIHRVEERLKRLKAVKERGSSEQEYKTFKVVENTEAMRYQIIFDGKPDAEIRTLLKSNGFKWAPSQGAWQRQITSNGKWALKKVVEKLKEMEA